MANTDRILDYLKSIAPERVTNAVIGARTGIRPHQQVFQITARLAKEGVIEARQYGKEWEFWWKGPAFAKIIKPPPTPHPADGTQDSTGAISPDEFERFARRHFEKVYGRPLPERLVDRAAKKFDFVSEDLKIIGDAKSFTLVRGTRYPPAKMSVIAEHVWLLENTDADEVFLVFGNERRVPEYWLAKYGHLVGRTRFYFLTSQDESVLLN